MGISRYLAMTAAEMEAFSVPEGWRAAYMACHFSPYGTGLSNIPASLPADTMLILNDRTPICGHDPQRIAEQLLTAVEHLQCSCVLLDFERQNHDEFHTLCQILADQLPCPVGISSLYAQTLDCPVFLPPPPLDQPLTEYIEPWKGRELWLDIAPDAACVTVTEHGSHIEPVPFSVPPENAFLEETLHCYYRSEVLENEIKFYLWRDLTQVDAIINQANLLGVSKCIGLYQQLGA